MTPERGQMAMDILAESYFGQAKYSQAEALFARLLEGRRRVLGPQHPDTVNTLLSLGRVRFQQQEYAEATSVSGEVLNGFEKANSNSWTRYYSQSLLGASLVGQAKYADAEPRLISGFEGMIRQEASIPAQFRPELEQAGERIIQLYQAWGKPDRAAEWGKKFERAEMTGCTCRNMALRIPRPRRWRD
jgi:tetratricopeptide (TPR) repeat protein